MRDKAATSRPPTLTQAVKVLGDRWLLLIVRDMMFGQIHSFKELLENSRGHRDEHAFESPAENARLRTPYSRTQPRRSAEN